MRMGEPFSGAFELDKDTDNTVRIVEEPVFDANQLPAIGHSAFTARLYLASAVACRTITATTTHGTSRFASEYDDRVGDLL